MKRRRAGFTLTLYSAFGDVTCRASFCHKAFLANHFKSRVGQNRQAVCAFTSHFLHQLHLGFRQRKLNKYRPKDMSTHLTGPSRLHMPSHAALGKLDKPQTCSSKAAKESSYMLFSRLTGSHKRKSEHASKLNTLQAPTALTVLTLA